MTMNFPLMNRWKKMGRLESVTTSLQDYKMDYLLYITTIFRRMQQRLYNEVYNNLFETVFSDLFIRQEKTCNFRKNRV